SSATTVFPVLPLVIFAAEACVVTLSTVRIIFISRGMKVRAAVLGLFEITTWLFAIGQVMQNLNDVGCYVGFAAGFTLGNFLGICIEEKLAVGNVVLRVITNRDAGELVGALRAAECGVTSVSARGGTGPVQIVLTVIKRRDLKTTLAILKAFDPGVFYSVEN